MPGIIKNMSLYTIGNILPQAVGFLLLPVYTHYLTPTDYGIVSSMQVLSSILVVFFTMAIDRSLYRLYFDYKTDKDKKDYLGTITISLLFISIIVLALLFIFRSFVGLIYESIPFFPFYAYAILTTFFMIFAIVPKIFFQVNEEAGKFVSISLLQFLLSTGLTIWFVVVKSKGAEGMLEGKMIAEVIVLPLFLYISYRTINFTFNKQYFKDSIAFSLPMIPALLMAWILNLSDRIFVERYFNLHDVGIYAMGYKIAGLVLIGASAFRLAYNPIFYKLANSDNQVDAKKKLFMYNNTFITGIFFISFLITFFSNEVIYLFLDAKYYEASKFVPIIAFAYLVGQISGLFNLMVYQVKKVMPLTIIGVISASINILLNYLLVPSYGAYGASYATVISFLILLFLSWQYAKKCYFIPVKWSLILYLLISAIIIIYLFSLINLSVILVLSIKIIFVTLLTFVLYKRYFKSINVMLKER